MVVTAYAAMGVVQSAIFAVKARMSRAWTFVLHVSRHLINQTSEERAMGLKYMGYAVNYTEVHIGIVGDGVSKSLTVDLTAAPFALAFPQKNWPTGCKVQMQDGEVPQSVTLTATQTGVSATIQFANAPPLPPAGMLSPRTQMILWLVYG